MLKHKDAMSFDPLSDGISEVSEAYNGHDDLSVVNSARVSLDKQSYWRYACQDAACEVVDFKCKHCDCSKTLSERDVKLVRYLAEHGHWSPFAHAHALVVKNMSRAEMLSWMIQTQDYQFYRMPLLEYLEGSTARIMFIERGSAYSWISAGIAPPVSASLDASIDAWKRAGRIRDHVQDDNVVSDVSKFLGDERGLNQYLRDVSPNTSLDVDRIANLLTLTVRIKMPIAIARQWFKHVIGIARNEVSRRYVDDTPEFYMPRTWRSRPKRGVKQGSGEGHREYVDLGLGPSPIHDKVAATYGRTRELYESLVDPDNGGVAPEQARFVLPVGHYTHFWDTMTLSAAFRIYARRAHKDAQDETGLYAMALGKIAKARFPHIWASMEKKALN